MKWPEKLIEAKFLKRYKRFFADVEIDHRLEVAHVANTGSLKSCGEPGNRCLVSKSQNPERKLKYSLEAIEAGAGVWVGVNTSVPNKLVKEAFLTRPFPHWQKYAEIQSEVKINSETRLDFCLSIDNKSPKKHYVEVKNVTLAIENKKGRIAAFPDAETERGRKHLRELMKLIDQGHSAEIFYTIQRADCQFFAPADEIDGEYGQLLRQAQKKGVRISPYVVVVNENEVVLSHSELELRL